MTYSAAYSASVTLFSDPSTRRFVNMRCWTRGRQWRLWEPGRTEPYCWASAWSSSPSWCTSSWESPYCVLTPTGNNKPFKDCFSPENSEMHLVFGVWPHCDYWLKTSTYSRTHLTSSETERARRRKWLLFLYSVWTDETSCTIVNSTIVWHVNCSYSCGAECWKSSRYPCLQVYVSLNSSGKVIRLLHNEETQESNPEVLHSRWCSW